MSVSSFRAGFQGIGSPSSVSPSASSHFVHCVCLSLLCLPSLCLRNGAAEVGRNVGHRHRSDFTFFSFRFVKATQKILLFDFVTKTLLKFYRVSV